MEQGTIEKMAMMWALVARMNAIIASIEGMKAENQFRLECGNGIAYGIEHFHEAQISLEAVSSQLSQMSGR